MTAANLAMLIIYASPDGNAGWTPVLPADVPDWVKDPDTLGKMIAGNACQNPNSASRSTWYRAVRVMSSEEQKREQAKLYADKQKRRRRQAALRALH